MLLTPARQSSQSISEHPPPDSNRTDGNFPYLVEIKQRYISDDFCPMSARSGGSMRLLDFPKPYFHFWKPFWRPVWQTIRFDFNHVVRGLKIHRFGYVISDINFFVWNLFVCLFGLAHTYLSCHCSKHHQTLPCYAWLEGRFPHLSKKECVPHLSKERIQLFGLLKNEICFLHLSKIV